MSPSKHSDECYRISCVVFKFKDDTTFITCITRIVSYICMHIHYVYVVHVIHCYSCEHTVPNTNMRNNAII